MNLLQTKFLPIKPYVFLSAIYRKVQKDAIG